MSHSFRIAAGTMFSRILSRVQERFGVAALAFVIMLGGVQT
ncbi:MAG: copper chaperone PCu(A)C, partial [Mesorhizobium sp.]